jgi:predicted nucleic acid-binding protein
MGLAERFEGSLVYIDSAPLIYFFEAKFEYFKELSALFNAFDQGKIELVSSTLTVTEVLAHPLRLGEVSLIKTYEGFFENENSIRLIDVSLPISKLAAEFRATHNLKTPDAIHVATAIKAEASCFITNDFQLKKVSDLEIITLK